MTPTQKPAPDLHRLPVLMNRLHAEVGRRSGGRGLQELHDLGLSMPQMIAMHVLLGAPGGCPRPAGTAAEPDPGMGMQLLSEALHLSPSAVTTLVDRLVERQLVERWENPADRRQKQVRLRPEGVELVERMTRSRAAEFASALSDLDAGLQAELLDVLQRVCDALAGSSPARPTASSPAPGPTPR